MAFQNFLSGGYIGKLGETVGQRWRNKRTVRVHVPHNTSKTPLQMTAREQFKLANQLAQQAMNFNKGASVWQTPDNNEWSLRVGTAMRRIRMGLPSSECIPYYPDEKNKPFTITAVDFAVMSHFSACTFVNNTVAIPNNRTIRFSYHVYNISTGQMETRTIDKSFANGETFSMSIPNDDTFIWVHSSWVEGASIDNNQFGGIAITFQRQSLAANVPLNINVPVTFSEPNYSIEENRVYIQANIPNTPFLFRDLFFYYNYTDENGNIRLAEIEAPFLTHGFHNYNLEEDWEEGHSYEEGSGIPQQSITFNEQFFNIVFNIEELTMEEPFSPALPNIYLTFNGLTSVSTYEYELSLIANKAFTDQELEIAVDVRQFTTGNVSMIYLDTPPISGNGQFSVNFTVPTGYAITEGCRISLTNKNDEEDNNVITSEIHLFTSLTAPRVTILCSNGDAVLDENEVEFFFRWSLNIHFYDVDEVILIAQIRGFNQSGGELFYWQDQELELKLGQNMSMTNFTTHTYEISELNNARTASIMPIYEPIQIKEFKLNVSIPQASIPLSHL